MISHEDIIAMCGLTQEEVDALAEHEHMTDVAAAALGAYLLHQDKGADRIAAMIRDDIRAALLRNEKAHARDLFTALRHFLAEHRTAMR